ncbi:MAG: hypothetical protein J0I81_00215, partial [Hyphomicrobium sp.]|nr:hypothetical protein [Hyphomicrobium sp.]
MFWGKLPFLGFSQTTLEQKIRCCVSIIGQALLESLRIVPSSLSMRQLSETVESANHSERAEIRARVVLERTRNLVGFIAIFGAVICGYASVGAWTIVIATLAPASLSQAEYGA